jgi:hypothetical protein
MEPIIHNLDEERQPEYIKIAGRELDISFIPSGISIPLLGKYQEYVEILKTNKVINSDGTANKEAEEELSGKPDKALESMDIMTDMVCMFTEYKDPEMTREWVGHNTNLKQLARLIVLITGSLTRDMKKKKDDTSKKKLDGNES